MVKWTDHAKAQLHHIYEYISQDSPFYARQITEALVIKTIGLDELPRKGHKVIELNEDTVRELSYPIDLYCSSIQANNYWCFMGCFAPATYYDDLCCSF